MTLLLAIRRRHNEERIHEHSNIVLCFYYLINSMINIYVTLKKWNHLYAIYLKREQSDLNVKQIRTSSISEKKW